MRFVVTLSVTLTLSSMLRIKVQFPVDQSEAERLQLREGSGAKRGSASDTGKRLCTNNNVLPVHVCVMVLGADCRGPRGMVLSL